MKLRKNVDPSFKLPDGRSDNSKYPKKFTKGDYRYVRLIKRNYAVIYSKLSYVDYKTSIEAFVVINTSDGSNKEVKLFSEAVKLANKYKL